MILHYHHLPPHYRHHHLNHLQVRSQRPPLCPQCHRGKAPQSQLRLQLDDHHDHQDHHDYHDPHDHHDLKCHGDDDDDKEY